MSHPDPVRFHATGDTGVLYGLADLPFSPAVVVEAGASLVFVSGSCGPPVDQDDDTSVDAEVRRAFANLGRSLESADCTLSDVVSVTKYLTDVAADNDVVARLTRETFDPLPASTTVEVNRLVPEGLRFEVSAVAVRRGSA